MGAGALTDIWMFFSSLVLKAAVGKMKVVSVMKAVLPCRFLFLVFTCRVED